MTLVNAETGELIAECSTDEARDLTDRIRTAVSVAWELVAEAYSRQAHRALGYSSWDAYVAAEFGSARLRLPREERTEIVGSLREQGLSIRAIAAATGAARSTVEKDLSRIGTPESADQKRSPEPEPKVTPNFKGSPAPKPAPPKPITGLDGKSYTPKPKPEPADEADQINDAVQRAADPLLTYRANVSKALSRANDLTSLDVAKAVESAGESAVGHRQIVAAVKKWCDDYLAASRPDHLRSVQ